VDDKLQTERESSRIPDVSLFAGRAEQPVEGNAGMEWGIASMGLGGVLAVMVPATLILVFQLEAEGFRGFTRTDIRIAALAGYLATFLFLGLTVLGLIFGVRSILASRRQRKPIALGLAGLLLNVLNLYLWMGSGVAWLFASIGRF
jgi:hypothetical protein